MKYNKSSKKLAICIPTFNRAKLLDRLLKSIPSSPKIIISVCDDGSQDNTLDIINKHKSRLLIKYSFQKNEGRASALRKAILNFIISSLLSSNGLVNKMCIIIFCMNL